MVGNGDDHNGLANHLIRWRRVDVWDYYELEHGIGEGSIGSISLVKRRKGTEGGSAYTNHQRTTPINAATSDTKEEKKSKKSGVFGRVWSQLQQQLSKRHSHTGNQKNTTSLLKRKKHLGAKEYAVPSRHTEKYALKNIQLRLVEKRYLDELRNEIDVLRDLDHPNIVKAYEVYESKTNIYIVMEYCSGGDLYARAPYTENQVVPVISQLCSAICFMHKHGVVHRDIKMENIMFETTSPLAKIKVLDFGLSKKFVPGTRGIMHEWGGTVYTMSPQVLNGTYNFKADIWSIGVLAYLLLADEKPFKGKNKQDVMQNIKKVNYNFKAHEWDSISQDAKDFVSSLLVYDADDRPTANEALQHPWLLAKANSNSRRSSSSSMQNKLGGTRRDSHELMKDVNDCIMAYKSCSEMKKIAAVIIAHKSSAAEILEIRQAFDKYDRTKDGQISMEEFKLALAEFNYSDDELNDMFSKMDVTHNGVILYTEFIAATLEMRGIVEEKRLAEAFDLIDDDDSGYITKSDLRKLLGPHVPQSRVDKLLKEADKDNDGMVSFEDFLKMFREDNTKRLSSFDLDDDDDDDEDDRKHKVNSVE